ncbi:hypothetical protein [Pseudooctadecabacter jejudonensis]|uniref:hypothetical protein n=1 Tax=Pseudooctadecabacter jejudonensis TaxID=1391910 RepID=UPI000A26A85F|nr:hypothetical protein [Pseudooctadecabacter jejudonensis]
MSTGIICPIYAEIAEHLGIPAEPAQWRTATKSGGVSFDLEEMVARSFAAFEAARPDSRTSIREALGGEAAVARYAAA